MKTVFLVVSVFALCAVLAAQVSVPAGTVIPVQLNSTVNAKRLKPGQAITAKVAQDVPLNNGEKIKAGSRVMGQFVAATPAQGSQQATVTFRFDKVEVAGQALPIVTNLRALASPLEVEAAQTDITSEDRGSTPPWAQNLTLVGGGDAVYREEGTVVSADETVGQSVYAGRWGVLSRVAADPGDKCRGAVAGNDQPQALWVFSHDACGVYGYDSTIMQAGRKNPQGNIVLASASEGGLKLRNGSAMLLRVNGGGEVSQNEAAK